MLFSSLCLPKKKKNYLWLYSWPKASNFLHSYNSYIHNFFIQIWGRAVLRWDKQVSSSQARCVEDASFHKTPAVTLHVSLFLIRKLWLTEVHLNRIYKRQKIASCRWSDNKCWPWLFVWTGLVWLFTMFVCMTCFFFSLRVKHMKAFPNAQWKQNSREHKLLSLWTGNNWHMQLAIHCAHL